VLLLVDSSRARGLTISEEFAMQPLSPAEALTRLNETVTVEMTVRRAKCCSGSGQFFLDSEANYRDATAALSR
jgi:hypothetical protein